MASLHRAALGPLPFLVCLGCSCSRQPDLPLVRELRPAQGLNRSSTPVEIIGERFLAAAHANFDNRKKARLDLGFTARLGPHPLGGLRYQSSSLLEAEVPAGLPAGTYDLLVVDPRGREGRLPRAFTVLGGSDGGNDSLRDRSTLGGGDARAADVNGEARPDAHLDGPPPLDQQLADLGCPPACANGCSGGICKLDCSAASCSCPPGMACEVSCSSPGACPSTIDCSQANSCVVKCGNLSCTGPILCGTGKCVIDCSAQSCKKPISCAGECHLLCTGGSCAGLVTCGGGPCTLECAGSSCQGGIDCSQACACQLTCLGGSCAAGLLCPSPFCLRPAGDGCLLTPPALCNHCP